MATISKLDKPKIYTESDQILKDLKDELAHLKSRMNLIEEEQEHAPVVGTVADLMWVVNQDSVELHPWQSRVDHLHEPDLVVFDLDPGQGTPFTRTCEAAMVIKEI